MKICVVGSGYVGLVTGACLADFGMQVTGVDKDAGKVESLQSRGEMPIYEPGLRPWCARTCSRGGSALHHRPGAGIEEAQAVFHRRRDALAVPDGSADLQFIEAGGDARSVRPPERLQGGGDQEHGADRHRPASSSASSARSGWRQRRTSPW